MIVLQNLTGELNLNPPPWVEPRGNVATLCHELAPGAFVFVNLGATGLVVENGRDRFGIPLDLIIKLAQQHQPGLVPKIVPDATPATKEA